MDLFIVAGEASGDLHGAKLVEELLQMRPELKIGAVAGPNLRKLPIEEFFRIEDLSVMGFIDVLLALPKIIKQFFAIRKKILERNPKAVILIDYPGFNLRLERSLRKKGYRGKLIHFICPTVWAWGKKRVFLMEKHLDLLLTIFPFEHQCFEKTTLPVKYVGHPLSLPIEEFVPQNKYLGKILAIFPGSRKAEIERNLPLQLKAARRLQNLDKTLQIAVSTTQLDLDLPADVISVPLEDNYELMRSCHMAIATSGTVTLELALQKTPTVVVFAIKPLDCFLAQKVFRINLPFYCIANIIAGHQVFPELFGPHFTEDKLFFWAQKLWSDEQARRSCLEGCLKVRKSLEVKRASKVAAETIISAI